MTNWNLCEQYTLTVPATEQSIRPDLLIYRCLKRVKQRPLSNLFSNFILHHVQNQLYYEKQGIRTQGRRMQCVEEITGLWAVAPIGVLFLPNPSYLPRPNFGCPLSILINENNYCLVFCVVKRLACPFRMRPLWFNPFDRNSGVPKKTISVARVRREAKNQLGPIELNQTLFNRPKFTKV